MRFLSFRWLLLLTLTVIPANNLAAENAVVEGVPDDVSVDFHRDVEPILKQHCWSCHGAEKQDADLRLDFLAHAQHGGNSGQPILTGGLETNEIYQRVMSDDPAYRMPRYQTGLTLEELAILTQWVLEDCPWPEELPQVNAAATPHQHHWSHDYPWIVHTLNTLEHYQSILGWLLALSVVMLLLEQWKGLIAAEHRWTRGKISERLNPLLFRLQPAHHLIVMLLFLCGASWKETLSLKQQLETATSKSEKPSLTVAEQKFELPKFNQQTVEEIYGNPPVPHRPHHPPRLTGTYYRGNCERNYQLNHWGNYRTATFQLCLCDADGRPVKVGEHVAGRELFLKLEMDRSPYTSDALFSDRIMSTVFLSKYYSGLPDDPDKDDRIGLRTLARSWKWDVMYPLKNSPMAARENLSNLVYLYKGDSMEFTNGRIHYGLKYDVKIEDGRIAKGSEVWMNSLFWQPHLAVPQPGKVPLTEWFNHYPIPELTSVNIDDPKLIGIGDYLEQNTEPEISPSAN